MTLTELKEWLKFLDDKPYSERVVADYRNEGLVVSTSTVNDGFQPYETGVRHPDYNSGKFIIVETYPDKESAVISHEKWVKTMTGDNLPAELQDCLNCRLGRAAWEHGNEMVFKRHNGFPRIDRTKKGQQ